MSRPPKPGRVRGLPPVLPSTRRFGLAFAFADNGYMWNSFRVLVSQTFDSPDRASRLRASILFVLSSEDRARGARTPRPARRRPKSGGFVSSLRHGTDPGSDTARPPGPRGSPKAPVPLKTMYLFRQRGYAGVGEVFRRVIVQTTLLTLPSCGSVIASVSGFKTPAHCRYRAVL